MSESEASGPGSLRAFWIIALGLASLRLGLGFLAVPLGLIASLSVLVTVLFVALPFIALFSGASIVGKPRSALGLLVFGAALHGGSILLLERGMVLGFAAASVAAVAQIGLLAWCLGLGLLIARVVKDKHLIVPVCIFLAIFDAFLVLTPIGLTKQVMQRNPRVLPAVSLSVPKVVSAPTSGPIGSAAHIGPADLLFSAFFFGLLYRFSMEVRTTALWLAPTLLVYLVGALLIGPLPALVPIGLCVLIVNWRHFRLTKEEWGSTAVITLLAGAGLIWGLMQPEPRVAPSPPAPFPEAPRPGGLPGQASPGPRP
ncbi:MAG: hypothetical protein WAO58_03825 [Fimbriimonadaceae bacterium]